MTVIYLHIMLNISKHNRGRNGDLSPTVCVACWNVVPQCMKLLGNLTNWHIVLEWSFVGSFTKLLLDHYSVGIGDPNTISLE